MPRSVENIEELDLLERGMKLFEKVLEERLRKLIKKDGWQFDLCPGMSTTDVMFEAITKKV